MSKEHNSVCLKAWIIRTAI